MFKRVQQLVGTDRNAADRAPLLPSQEEEEEQPSQGRKRAGVALYTGSTSKEDYTIIHLKQPEPKDPLYLVTSQPLYRIPPGTVSVAGPNPRDNHQYGNLAAAQRHGK